MLSQAAAAVMNESPPNDREMTSARYVMGREASQQPRDSADLYPGFFLCSPRGYRRRANTYRFSPRHYGLHYGCFSSLFISHMHLS